MVRISAVTLLEDDDLSKLDLDVYLYWSTGWLGRECLLDKTWLSVDEQITFRELRANVVRAFPALPDGRSFKVQWKDADGDHVTIATDEELRLALAEMKGPIYRLEILMGDDDDDDVGGGGDEKHHQRFAVEKAEFGCCHKPIKSSAVSEKPIDGGGGKEQTVKITLEGDSPKNQVDISSSALNEISLSVGLDAIHITSGNIKIDIAPNQPIAISLVCSSTAAAAVAAAADTEPSKKKEVFASPDVRQPEVVKNATLLSPFMPKGRHNAASLRSRAFARPRPYFKAFRHFRSPIYNNDLSDALHGWLTFGGRVLDRLH